MKKGNIILLSILAVLVLLVFNACGSYNSMNEKRTLTEGAWAKVQSAYQRRLDLIPNLVATVKGAANFEQKTLTDVVEARAKATGIQLNTNDLTPDKIAQFDNAQTGLSGALSRLLVVAEAYPTLTASESFRGLQTQLEGTENRIAVERKTFNEIVKDYNSHIRSFPNNLFAGMFGFTPKDYFKAAAGSDKAPEVKF